MNKVISALKKSSIFKNLDEGKILKVIEEKNYRLSSYSKGEAIAIEEDFCNRIGIVVDGTVEVQKIFASGKTVTINRLEQGDTFGEVILFSDVKKYPATVICASNAYIIFITKEEMLKLCSLNIEILNNFMGLLSNKIFMLNKKVKTLSYQSIRQKLSNYILEESKKQKSFTVKFNISRKEMAEQLGIPRPSLSREMISMKEEEIIDFNKNIIKILDEEALETELL
ncbi:Crp/Fnr family transcriptional regulator [Clostridium lundense]|uniref:Crp/Fnr family transcriptional regulator n=1 Tax=Clostridium lundense TaxID=319475 RepID=UPI000488F149|nr:Crp/Fnr family transcriptional regulator [Clostridium lundense]